MTDIEIPKFVCIEGCHDCCGRVTFSAAEKEAVDPSSMLGIEWREHGAGRWMPEDGQQTTRCAFLGRGGCTIYDERPMPCRLFGSAQGMECGHGCRPRQMLSRMLADKLISQGTR